MWTLRDVENGLSDNNFVILRGIFVEATSTLAAAIVLADIVYWFNPAKNGKSKLASEHDGMMWLIAPRTYWKEKLRITLRQADRALEELCALGLIEKKRFLYGSGKSGAKLTTHVKLVDNFEEVICEILNRNLKELDGYETPIVKELNVKGKYPDCKIMSEADSPTGESGMRLTHLQVSVQSPTGESARRKSHSIPLKLRLIKRLNTRGVFFPKKKNKNSNSIRIDNQEGLGLGGWKMNYRWVLANGQNKEEIASLMRKGEARYNVRGEVEIRVEEEVVSPPPDETPEEYFDRLGREREQKFANNPTLSAGDYKTRISAAIASGIEQKKASGLSDSALEYVYSLPEQMTGLAFEFCAGFGRAPLKAEKGRWMKDFSDMLEMGIEPRDVKSAIKRMKSSGLTIKAPGSVTSVAWNIHDERKAKRT